MSGERHSTTAVCAVSLVPPTTATNERKMVLLHTHRPCIHSCYSLRFTLYCIYRWRISFFLCFINIFFRTKEQEDDVRAALYREVKLTAKQAQTQEEIRVCKDTAVWMKDTCNGTVKLAKKVVAAPKKVQPIANRPGKGPSKNDVSQGGGE